MKKIGILIICFFAILFFVKVISSSVLAGCRCPGPDCDHCDGGPKVGWDNRDQNTCESFSDWKDNSGNCSGGGGGGGGGMCGGGGRCDGCCTDPANNGTCSDVVAQCNGCPHPCAPPCDANSWGACSSSSGPGTQYNACGNSRNCCTSNWSGWSACSKPCDDGSGPGTQSRNDGCGNTQTQNCNTFSCYIPYPTPTPSQPTPTPVGYTPTPSSTPSPHGYFPGWFNTENGDVHSNKDIIVSLPTILVRFATYLVTASNLSSFAAGSAQDARPELASTKNWYWYSPPYGAVNFPENSGFYAYYTHNKPPDNKIVSDALNNSSINTFAQNGKSPKIQVDSTVNTVSINENISLSADKILVLYIDGDLNVNANITFSDNSGIIFVIKGNLNIAPQVTQADGFYLVDKTVNSTDGSGAGSSLLIHGAVFVSQNGKIFGTSRQIHDANTPSEKIIYEPKYLIEFAQGLGHAGITWREVAP